ncbi:MAG TPA: alkaline phosphatase D family protein, partial [Solimonas sp.]|nr:alkaline phosphatase D family protein [Solimonas sp.]
DPEDSLWFPAADADTDWLARPPPSWAAHEEVQALLVLPLYPQHACMGEGGFDPGDAAIAERMWSGGFRGLRQLQAFAVPSAGNPEQDEMKKAVARALREYNRVTDTAGRCLEPPALVRLPVVEGGSGLRLALGSCHYPPGILNELPAQASWTRLNARLDGAVSERPQLLVLTGDQVYADATAGLFDPSQADDRFRKPYETWLRNRQVRDTLRRLPLVAMLDDHEIDDNWEPLGPAAPAEARELNRQRCDRGVRYFQRFQRLRQATPDASGPLWSIVKHLDVPMFLVDTRTQRCCRATGMPATGPEALLGREQWTALRDWLMDSPRDRPRLIVSPSLLLPRHRDAAPAVLATGVHDSADRAARRADGWSGYPDACCALLDWIAGQQIHGVVFLSGDEHLGLHANASISRNGQPAVTVHSIHAPGLNSPYRFANARPADFILDENFLFRSNGVENHCELQTRVFEGAGFAHISLQPDSNGKGWTLACEFDAEGGGAARRWSIHLPMG